MTLAKRVIPTMLVRGRTLVKGKQFAGDRSIGHVQQAARVHAMRGVDELLILDIGATAEDRGPDLDMVRELSAGCLIPITVGGGVKSIEDIDALLRAGADKVAIGAAQKDTNVIAAASQRFGSQAVVAAIDVRPNGRIAWNCGKEPAAISAVWWAQQLKDQGAGEILLGSIDRDGTMQGYDLDLIEAVSNTVSIPVVASGGCSGYADMLEALKRGASAVAAGALFAFTDATPKGAATFLRGKGIEVRL